MAHQHKHRTCHLSTLHQTSRLDCPSPGGAKVYVSPDRLAVLRARTLGPSRAKIWGGTPAVGWDLPSPRKKNIVCRGDRPRVGSFRSRPSPCMRLGHVRMHVCTLAFARANAKMVAWRCRGVRGGHEEHPRRRNRQLLRHFQPRAWRTACSCLGYREAACRRRDRDAQDATLSSSG